MGRRGNERFDWDGGVCSVWWGLGFVCEDGVGWMESGMWDVGCFGVL